MAWCHQATSHYLSQYWPSSVSPYGVTRLQWENSLILDGLDNKLKPKNGFQLVRIFWNVNMDSNLMEECSYQWVQSAKCHIWSVMIFESTCSSIRDHATCCNIISAMSLVLSASRLSALDILFFPWREFKGWEGLLVPLVGTISWRAVKTTTGVGGTKPVSTIIFSLFQNYQNLITCQIYIHSWQTSLQLSCSDVREIWMWFKGFNRCLC